MKRSTATVAAATSRCFAPKIIRTSKPPLVPAPFTGLGAPQEASLPTTMGGCQERMRRRECAAPQPTAVRQGARRTGGPGGPSRRGVQERVSTRIWSSPPAVARPSRRNGIGGGRAGRASGMSVGSPRGRRMRSITAGSSITAMSCRRPPHRGHSRTSNPKLRRMNSAQRPFAAGGGSPAPAASLESSGGEFSWEPTGSPNRTTSARHAARGASTP